MPNKPTRAAQESTDAPKAPNPPEPPATEDSPERRPPPLAGLFELESAASDDQIRSVVEQQISQFIEETDALDDHNLLVLYDGRSIERSDANRIYRALSDVDRTRHTLLVLRSPGGDIAAAYFIGKLCREHTETAFHVAIPREAKSAATLICCGADEIHMGSLSELGPIDPQFGGMPALATKHSLEHLAEIASRHSGAKEMLSDYLAKSLPVTVVGYFERAAGSAAQYAERLLSKRLSPMAESKNTEIANRLVYDYKDHGFAIDASEACTIFGHDMVKVNSSLYDVANQIYEQLDLIEFIVGQKFGRKLAFTGGIAGSCILYGHEDSGQ